MLTEKYLRKTFEVSAVRVTEDNFYDVAKWCQGEIRTTDEKKFIRVRVANVLNERQSQAFVGDWVLYAGTGYKVYNDKAFKKSFDKAPTPAEV